MRSQWERELEAPLAIVPGQLTSRTGVRMRLSRAYSATDSRAMRSRVYCYCCSR
jgi:hypothetical protein